MRQKICRRSRTLIAGGAVRHGITRQPANTKTEPQNLPADWEIRGTIGRKDVSGILFNWVDWKPKLPRWVSENRLDAAGALCEDFDARLEKSSQRRYQRQASQRHAPFPRARYK